VDVLPMSHLLHVCVKLDGQVEHAISVFHVTRHVFMGHVPILLSILNVFVKMAGRVEHVIFLLLPVALHV